MDGYTIGGEPHPWLGSELRPPTMDQTIYSWIVVNLMYLSSFDYMLPDMRSKLFSCLSLLSCCVCRLPYF